MNRDRRIQWIIVAVVVALVALLFLWGPVEDRLAPEPVRAWIAIEGPDGMASTGPRELEAGQEFTLHAVLEAEDISGNRVFYTEAARLTIQGEPIAPESLRVWKRPEELRVLWFTAEGFAPYLEVQAAEDLETFRFQENFRADWPQAWTIPGQIGSSSEMQKPVRTHEGVPRFGTQRFHVRLELFGPESRIRPRQRFQSLQAVELMAREEEFARVTVRLPPPLSAASEVFGISEIEGPGGESPDVMSRISGWSEMLLAFSRATVLQRHLDDAGRTYGSLVWSEVDLAQGPDWATDDTSDGAAVGDLLRVGERFVFLYEDRGTPGILDRRDLCLDFDKGGHVRELGEVFTGEGLVDWASLVEPS